MPSTYSPNLALELPGTGDQSGTWGNTTNTNLGTLIEQAISGYEIQSLTSGVTLTLTIPNGSSGVARNMYLEFTGNGSTVIVPANKKLYFVYNNCASGTITMKVAGQTGVTLEKGSKQILVSNGTDIVSAVSSGTGDITFSSGTISTSGTNQNIVIDPNGTGQVIVGSSTSQFSGTVFQAISHAGNVYAAGFKSTDYFRTTTSCWNSDTSNNNSFIEFATEGTYTGRGSITYNRGAGQVAYNATSDRRSKTIIGPVTNSGQVVDSLNVYTGRMNWGTLEFPMLIADEAQQVVPYCVTGQPNAVDDKGNPIYQQIDYSALVALLLAEIKSLRARVAALENN
jgi:hypothetical protein